MGMKFSWDFPGISREFPGIFRSRKSGMEFSIYLHSRSRKWEWNLPFTFTFPFPKMGMEFAISRSRSRSPKVIPAHGCCSLSEGPYGPGGVLSDYEGGGKGGSQFGDPKVYSRTDPTLLTRFTKFDKFTRSTRISRFTTTIFSIQFPPFTCM